MPITTAEQRRVLDQASRAVRRGVIDPAHKSFIQQRNTYDGQCKAAGLSNMHGLRHRYAQDRYEVLTAGRHRPLAAFGAVVDACAACRDAARQAISRELGHERTQITAVILKVIT